MPVVTQKTIRVKFNLDRTVELLVHSELASKGYVTPRLIADRTGEDIANIKLALKSLTASKTITCSDDYQLCCEDKKTLDSFMAKLRKVVAV